VSTTKTYRSGVSSQYHKVIIANNGDIADEQTVPGSSTWTNFVTHGDNVPGWREALRTGNSATTNLTGTKTEVRVLSGHHIWARPGTGFGPGYIVLMERSGNCGLSVAPPAGNPGTIGETKANNAALRKMVNKIIEANQSFQGGVFLGELRQTLTSIKNPARALRNSIDSWRYGAVRLRNRRDFRNVRFTPLKDNVHQALTDSWLEAQFHWKPLLNDIDSGAKALAEIGTGQSLSTGSLRAEATVSESAEEIIGSGSESIGKWVESELRLDDCQVIYRGAMRVNPRNSALMAPTLLGFNPASFIPTAWELVPYSFLIDYFTNIGDILNGWSILGTALSWANKTTRKSFTWTRTSRPTKALAFPTSTASGSTAQVVIKRTSVSRSDYTGGNFTPRFELEIPGFQSNKWLNIAALVVGRDSDRRFRFGD